MRSQGDVMSPPLGFLSSVYTSVDADDAHCLPLISPKLFPPQNQPKVMCLRLRCILVDSLVLNSLHTHTGSEVSLLSFFFLWTFLAFFCTFPPQPILPSIFPVFAHLFASFSSCSFWSARQLKIQQDIFFSFFFVDCQRKSETPKQGSMLDYSC